MKTNENDILALLTKNHFEEVDTDEDWTALEKQGPQMKSDILRVVHYPGDQNFTVCAYTHNYVAKWQVVIAYCVPTPVAVATLNAAIATL